MTGLFSGLHLPFPMGSAVLGKVMDVSKVRRKEYDDSIFASECLM